MGLFIFHTSHKPAKHHPMNGIIDVWVDNLLSEFDKIRRVVVEYSYISMDTEFPGVVARPLGNFTSQSFLNYQHLQCNVNILKIIQLGLTFSDKDGNMPVPSTWQFNFLFDTENDMYADESLCLLLDANLDFKKHREKGIRVEDFGELLMTSGLVLNNKVVWISFHSFYDFGYLLRILTGNALASDPKEFLGLLDVFFNNFYDLKYPLAGTQYCKKGLQEIAESLSIQRIGTAHQAGSDSLLTLKLFFKFKEMGFVDMTNSSSLNKLYGISRRLRHADVAEEASQ